MLELAVGLSDRVLLALADLEADTLESDGGRLKLEWGVLRSRPGTEVDDILWWEGERLVGFVGIYAFGPPTLELAGMVHPAWRRQGIATALLDAAVPLCRARGYDEALLVTPRRSDAGRALAVGRGGSLEHSEHALVLLGEPTDGPTDPGIDIRTATAADIPAVTSLLTAAFDSPPSPLDGLLISDSERTMLVEIAGDPVGTLRLTLDEEGGGIYGFAVDPARQGRGIGRDVLRRACRMLRQGGADRVHLEVEVDNERALGLYTSLGFTLVSTEDYYSLPVA